MNYSEADYEQYAYSGDVTGESAFEYEDDIGKFIIHRWTVGVLSGSGQG